jgi:hypothetical protein
VEEEATIAPSVAFSIAGAATSRPCTAKGHKGNVLPGVSGTGCIWPLATSVALAQGDNNLPDASRTEGGFDA